MDPTLTSWLHLIVRWFHVFAGMLWIGSTWHFGWLNRRFQEEEDKSGAEGETAQVWMVHSGALSVAERRKQPERVPHTLNWFRYEALFTWASGMALLTLVYYLGGVMVELESDLSVGAAIGMSLCLLVVSWLVYDLLWISPLGRNAILGGAVSYGLAVAMAYGLTEVFTGRAAYIHVGAVFGTLMTANVWFRILPAQRQMIAAVREGRLADPAFGERALVRSNHNTYMVVPVVFIMLSSHYPVATYGNLYNWQVLSVLILAGWGLSHWLKSWLSWARRPPRNAISS